MKRIEAGLRKFCSAELEPFLVMMYGTGSARNLDLPCPTVTADGNHIGLAQPFLVPIDNRSTEDGTRSADEPLGVVTTKARWCLAQPFVMHLTHQGAHGPRCHSVDNPLPTVTGANRGEMGLVEPFLVNMKGQSTASDIDKPAPTSTTRESLALVEPFLTKYYSTGQENLAHSINKPLDTVTTRERFGLCQPEFDGKRLDIKFRMLQPDELAAAMSLQRLEFKGTKKQIVKMIGNAVARRQARALCRALLAA